jgi:hypothetical protein
MILVTIKTSSKRADAAEELLSFLQNMAGGEDLTVTRNSVTVVLRLPGVPEPGDGSRRAPELPEGDHPRKPRTAPLGGSPALPRRPGRRGPDRHPRIRHGLTKHPLYSTWAQMLQRCENEGIPDYQNYGARGIRVCERWHDIAVFIADVEGYIGPRPEGMSLDRICNDHDYRLDNVRWASAVVQRRNQRRGAA